MELRELYQEIILDHGKNPRNKGKCEGYTNDAKAHNPLCGDKVHIYLKLNNERLIEDLSKYWNFENVDDAFTVINDISFHEARLLKLNCDKSLHYLNWQANMDFKQTVKFTGEWYYDFYNNEKSIFDKTISQINEYEVMAKKKGLIVC